MALNDPTQDTGETAAVYTLRTLLAPECRQIIRAYQAKYDCDVATAVTAAIASLARQESLKLAKQVSPQDMAWAS